MVRRHDPIRDGPSGERVEDDVMDASMREGILSILDGANDMTIATIRSDGYPHATTVSFASDELDIYFGCAEESQSPSRNDEQG
jgi:nitroimidazol reductase NimA-like FMN-containing flavoprotein (pyridoxamine 5'-phosphate oxidase superfamily)